MRSLGDHLSEVEDHGLLPFHPSCPICRCERLSGPFPVAPVVPQRARAALVAALLAAGTAGVSQPGGALADDPGEISDQELDNLAQGIDAASGPSPSDATTPPEGEDTDDTVTAGTGDDPPGAEPPIPGADDPAGDVEGAAAPPTQAPAALAQPAPSPPVQPAAPSLQPAAAPVHPAAPPDEPAAQPARPAAPPTERSAPSTQRAPATRAPAKIAPAHAGNAPAPVVPTAVDPAHTHAPRPAAEPPQTARPAAPAQTASTRAVRTVPPCSADRRETHVVEPGDSLWSIAVARLGPGASPAAVARQVARLWDLNSGRIASGKPDLLVPGECLVLSG